MITNDYYYHNNGYSTIKKKGMFIDSGQNIKCYIKSSAQKGKANQELITTLSDILSIAQKNIVIARGALSRKKLLIITSELSQKDILERLYRSIGVSP